MKTMAVLVIAVFLAGISTGCRHSCSTTVRIATSGNAADGNPHEVHISDQQVNDHCAGKYTIRWQARGPWWVEFDGAISPCGTDFAFEKGGKEVCTIDTSQSVWQQGYSFKYWALDDNTMSQDPVVFHDDAKGKPGSGANALASAPKNYCVDLSSGSPVVCNTNPAVPEEPVAPHPLDVIQWKGNSGWTVSFGSSTPCTVPTAINAGHAYCTIQPNAAQCANRAPYCQYSYTTNAGGTYHVNVYPPPAQK